MKRDFSNFRAGILVALLLSCFPVSAQSIELKDVDKRAFTYLQDAGIDTNRELNRYEGNYLNMVFSKRKKYYDFTGKSVAFLTGSSGNKVSDKQQYFALEKGRFSQKNALNGGFIIAFTAAQRIESGGYDVAVLYGSKVVYGAAKAVQVIRAGKPY